MDTHYNYKTHRNLLSKGFFIIGIYCSSEINSYLGLVISEHNLNKCFKCENINLVVLIGYAQIILEADKMFITTCQESTSIAVSPW